MFKRIIKNFKFYLKKKVTYFKVFLFPKIPISNYFGFERGDPIDRYYINNFIYENKNKIKGKILEIGDNRYSRNYTGYKKVIGIVPGKNILIYNLEKKPKKNIGKFDCIICTQVINYTFDFTSVIKNLHKLLNNGGSLLLTCSSTTRISNYDKNRYGDFWRFTDISLKKILVKFFNKKKIKVETFGNVSVCSKFLYGLSTDELSFKELNFKDKNYPLIICCVAKK